MSKYWDDREMQREAAIRRHNAQFEGKTPTPYGWVDETESDPYGWLEEPGKYLAPKPDAVQREEPEEQPVTLTVEEEAAEHLRIAKKTAKYHVKFDEWLLDALFDLLSANEWKALSYAVRRILNFQDKKEKGYDTIAQSQFIKGQFHYQTRERLSYGCGLREAALGTALKGLRDYGVMIRIAKYNYRAPDSKGDVYKLQRDCEKIDWVGLINRRRADDERFAEQTAKGRATKNAAR
jgi:hypothetical protein